MCPNVGRRSRSDQNSNIVPPPGGWLESIWNLRALFWSGNVRILWRYAKSTRNRWGDIVPDIFEKVIGFVLYKFVGVVYCQSLQWAKSHPNYSIQITFGDIALRVKLWHLCIYDPSCYRRWQSRAYAIFRLCCYISWEFWAVRNIFWNFVGYIWFTFAHW